MKIEGDAAFVEKGVQVVTMPVDGEPNEARVVGYVQSLKAAIETPAGSLPVVAIPPEELR